MTPNSEHTPGPWRIVFRTDGLDNIYAGNTDVALCVRHKDSALIAAAPRLLAALELVKPYIRSFPEGLFRDSEVKQVWDAIAEARGEVG